MVLTPIAPRRYLSAPKLADTPLERIAQELDVGCEDQLIEAHLEPALGFLRAHRMHRHRQARGWTGGENCRHRLAVARIVPAGAEPKPQIHGADVQARNARDAGDRLDVGN